MTRDRPSTVDAYLAQIAPGRRKELERVRGIIREHLPDGYQEVIRRGLIVHELPLETTLDRFVQIAKQRIGVREAAANFLLLPPRPHTEHDARHRH